MKIFRLKNKTDAQVAIEFLLIIAFLMAVFMLFFLVIGNNISTINTSNKEMLAEKVHEILIDEIKQAKNMGTGFEKAFLLPKNLGSMNYTIEIVNNTMLEIVFQDQAYIKALPSDTFGVFFKDNLDPDSGFYPVTISNEAGLISISVCTDCTYSYAQCYHGEITPGLGCNNMTLIFPNFKGLCCYDYGRCCP